MQGRHLVQVQRRAVHPPIGGHKPGRNIAWVDLVQLERCRRVPRGRELPDLHAVDEKIGRAVCPEVRQRNFVPLAIISRVEQLRDAVLLEGPADWARES
jgi:hypothetical protein